MAIAMEPLMVTGIVTEVGHRASATDSAFGDVGESWSVVHAVAQGGIADFVGGGHERHLAKETGLFQVAVCDVAIQVGCRYQASLDVSREWHVPEVGLCSGVKVHATHSGLGSVSGS